MSLDKLGYGHVGCAVEQRGDGGQARKQHSRALGPDAPQPGVRARRADVVRRRVKEHGRDQFVRRAQRVRAEQAHRPRRSRVHARPRVPVGHETCSHGSSVARARRLQLRPRPPHRCCQLSPPARDVQQQPETAAHVVLRLHLLLEDRLRERLKHSVRAPVAAAALAQDPEHARYRLGAALTPADDVRPHRLLRAAVGRGERRHERQQAARVPQGRRCRVEHERRRERHRHGRGRPQGVSQEARDVRPARRVQQPRRHPAQARNSAQTRLRVVNDGVRGRAAREECVLQRRQHVLHTRRVVRQLEGARSVPGLAGTRAMKERPEKPLPRALARTVLSQRLSPRLAALRTRAAARPSRRLLPRQPRQQINRRPCRRAIARQTKQARCL
eukprot:Unigene14740_Nuclearia_a/m.44317 Unigene14740_Nuclearia_a/g.44317  ORF Unigene14740_Nuclearia_a/g.44317 Unigene14740_Nuclearia_a/m.44317 type:complete len:387 (+) Unigene14740_Nuclearia_a:917-2077(+)